MWMHWVPALMAQGVGAAPGSVGAPGSVAAEAVRIGSAWDFVVKGGPLMIPIGLCSVLALVVFLERMISLRGSVVIPPTFVEGLPRSLKTDAVRRKALDYCRADDSPIARIFAVGIRRLREPVHLLEKHIEDAGQREVVKLRKYLRILSVIAAIAPLLGLLGTIFGMIEAFQTVAVSAEALGKTERLASGIYQAMITTAAGLLVAMPTVIIYHWLTGRIERSARDLDLLGVSFIETRVLEPQEPAAPLRVSANGVASGGQAY